MEERTSVGPITSPRPAGWRPPHAPRPVGLRPRSPAAERPAPWRPDGQPLRVRRYGHVFEAADGDRPAAGLPGVRAWITDRPFDMTFDGEAVALLPLQGIAHLAPEGGTPHTVCAGRGLLLPEPGSLAFGPDPFTGCVALLLVLDRKARTFIQQGLAPWPTSFDTEELMVSVLHELEPLVRRETDVLTLASDHLLMEFLLWHYGAHRDAVLRLPGQRGHRDGLYGRLLSARQRCENDPETRIGDLGATVHLSQAHFVRLFRSVFGHGPQQHLIHCRIARAMNLLAWTDLPVAEVAAACGYHDRTAFSRAFSNLGGLSPAEFRARARRYPDRIKPFFELRYEIFRC